MDPDVIYLIVYAVLGFGSLLLVLVVMQESPKWGWAVAISLFVSACLTGFAFVSAAAQGLLLAGLGLASLLLPLFGSEDPTVVIPLVPAMTFLAIWFVLMLLMGAIQLVARPPRTDDDET